MLAVARAMMPSPKLLLCDEPSLGLAPLITQELFKVLGSLRDEYGHVAADRRTERRACRSPSPTGPTCSRPASIVATGTGAELLADDTIKEAYLGVVN